MSSLSFFANNVLRTTFTPTIQEHIVDYDEFDDKDYKNNYVINNKYSNKMEKNMIFTTPERRVTFGSYTYDGDEDEEDENDEDDLDDDEELNKNSFVANVQQQKMKKNYFEIERADQSNGFEYVDYDVSNSEEEDGDDQSMTRHQYKHHSHLNPSMIASPQHKQNQRQPRRNQHNLAQQPYHNPYDHYKRKNVVKVDFTNLNTVSSSGDVMRGISSSCGIFSSGIFIIFLSFFSFIFLSLPLYSTSLMSLFITQLYEAILLHGLFRMAYNSYIFLCSSYVLFVDNLADGFNCFGDTITKKYLHTFLS